MARHSSGRTTDSRRSSPVLRLLLIAGCLLPSVRAGILAPEWSRPLPASVISVSVRPKDDGTEDLFLLLADGRVMLVSGTDSLRELGRAPAGTTALLALPCVCIRAGTPARGACETNTALLLAGDRLVAWNHQGRELWRAQASELSKTDSMAFIAWHEARPEYCAWQQGRPWLVTAGHEQVRATRLNPGFIPLDALIADLDADRHPDLVLFDGERLTVYYLHQNRELRCRWPATRNPQLATHNPQLIACATYDSLTALLIITGDTLRLVNGLTGVELSRLPADSTRAIPGTPAAICASGSSAYLATRDQDGRCYLSQLATRNLQLATYNSQPLGQTPQLAIGLLKDRPVMLMRTDYGPDRLTIYPPGLSAGPDNSPGYSGVRITRLIPLRLDDDTFPDLLVVRTSADAGNRIDAFTNRLGRLNAEFAQAQLELERAALSRNEHEILRALRRVQLLSRENPERPDANQEQRLLRRYRNAGQRRQLIVYLAAALLTVLATLLIIRLRRTRANPPGQQIESKPLPARVALAADLLALDHNYISKGNLGPALQRLIEIRNQHGLVRDRDLGTLGPDNPQKLIQTYALAIRRLINNTPTIPVLQLIQTTSGSSRLATCTPQTLILTPEQARQTTHIPGLTINCIRNLEHPDVYQRLRILANPELSNTLQHIILDHIRYASTWATITLQYIVNTQWNRRLIITLHSDSPRTINYHAQNAHLISQLNELASLLRPALQIPAYDYAPRDPDEKLRLSIADYISALEETLARLLAPANAPGTAPR